LNNEDKLRKCLARWRSNSVLPDDLQIVVDDLVCRFGTLRRSVDEVRQWILRARALPARRELVSGVSDAHRRENVLARRLQHWLSPGRGVKGIPGQLKSELVALVDRFAQGSTSRVVATDCADSDCESSDAGDDPEVGALLSVSSIPVFGHLEEHGSLVAALERVYRDWIAALHPGQRVGAELLVAACSDASVRLALERLHVPFGLEHRAWLRERVISETDAKVASSFMEEQGVARMSVEDLICAAQSPACEATLRVQSVKMLLKHFRWHLREHARRVPTMYEGFASCEAYWSVVLDSVMMRGVLRHDVRVCCNLSASVRVPLRGNSRCVVVQTPVLPDCCGGIAVGGDISEGQRLRKREGTAVHGFRVVPLASDFLCDACQCSFAILSLDALTGDEVIEWCMRLQGDGEVAATNEALSLLKSEQERLCLRTQAMRYAASISAGCADPEDAFMRFRDCLDFGKLERSVAERCISPAQRSVLEPERVRRGTSSKDVLTFYRGFGVVQEHGVDAWWAPGVLLVSEPFSWTDYSGEPRFCSSDLWYLRTWAVALGGFRCLSVAWQSQLLELEGEHDARSCFVSWPADCVPVSSSGWVHAMEMWPGGVPEPMVWMQLCALSPSKVHVLREKILALRADHGLVWRRECFYWEMTGALARLSSIDASKANRDGRCILDRWGSLTAAEWLSLLTGPPVAGVPWESDGAQFQVGIGMNGGMGVRSAPTRSSATEPVLRRSSRLLAQNQGIFVLACVCF
jgi:hypothetical protein